MRLQCCTHADDIARFVKPMGADELEKRRIARLAKECEIDEVDDVQAQANVRPRRQQPELFAALLQAANEASQSEEEVVDQLAEDNN